MESVPWREDDDDDDGDDNDGDEEEVKLGPAMNEIRSGKWKGSDLRGLR